MHEPWPSQQNTVSPSHRDPVSTHVWQFPLVQSSPEQHSEVSSQSVATGRHSSQLQAPQAWPVLMQVAVPVLPSEQEHSSTSPGVQIVPPPQVSGDVSQDAMAQLLAFGPLESPVWQRLVAEHHPQPD
jgi:hypothetical protein